MWSLVLALKTAVTYTFYASSKVGHLIVTTATSLLTNSLYLQSKLVTLLGIIFEDFIVFLRDVSRHVSSFITGVAYMVEWLSHGLYTVLNFAQFLQRFFCSLVAAAARGLLSVYNQIGNIFVTIKHVIILFGDGVWFITMYIPKSVVSLAQAVAHNAQNLSVQMYKFVASKTVYFYKSTVDFFYSGYHFMTDVPLESLVGILIAGCFLYIFVQFYKTMLVYFGGIFLSLKVWLRYKFSKLRRWLLDNKQTNCDQADKSLGDDKLCIICQEEAKCIVALPCRHLCLCTGCTRKLLRYGGNCPICRKPIRQTMKVFT